MRERPARAFSSWYRCRVRALIVEDVEKLAQAERAAFERAGFSVDVAGDGETGLAMARSGGYDIVILDRMLPKKTGFAVCRALRAEGSIVPIIMATALGDTDERVEGLDAGADDYIVKPFSLEELLARTRALLRRAGSSTPGEVLRAGDIVFDLGRRETSVAGEAVRLSPRELGVLEHLLRHAGQACSRQQILDDCWDPAFETSSNLVDVYVRQIRAKLSDDHERYIKTVRGFGYRLDA